MTAPAGMKYERAGILAVRPSAFMELFFEPPSRDNVQLEDATVVSICGPLTNECEPMLDSYEAIRARVELALAGPAPTVVLRIKSPGGDAQGAFECARYLRMAAEASGKRLVAYVDEACSAAYMLACAATEICSSQTGMLGSIGVLISRKDFSAQAAAMGVRVELITSGARKADGHPENPITDSEIAAIQHIVDHIAGEFFTTVAELRPNLQAPVVQAMQAQVFAGQQAVDAGLADRVCSFEQSLMVVTTNDGVTGMDLAKLLKTLAEAVESDDEKVSGAARAALAAIGASPKAEAEPEEPKAEGDTEEPKAEGDTDAPDDEETDAGQPKATTSIASLLAKQVAENKALKAQLSKQEKERLLASRADLSPELVKVLDALPLDQLKAALSAMPVTTKRPAVVTTVNATKPAGTGGPTLLEGEARKRMDAAMGLATPKAKINKVVGGTLYLNVPEDFEPRRLG
jgi:ClpP class serine protease